MSCTLRKLSEGLKLLAGERLETEVTGLHYDSRKIKPGYLFVCIKGFKTDGHLYIKDALSRGAAAILTERELFLPDGVGWLRVANSRQALPVIAANFYDHPSRELMLVGITGTNGKTTTSYLVENIFMASGLKTGLIGTICNKVGEQRLAVTHTTPESSDLQSLLRDMVAAGVDAAIMEVSSHGLALGRVKCCEFDVGIFTNLTQDHMDFHSDLEEYFSAKKLLFTGLGLQRQKSRPYYAVVNNDDPFGKELLKHLQAPAITYGIREKAIVKAEDILLQPKMTKFNLLYQGLKIPVELALPGLFNVYNALAAIAVCLEEGIPSSILQKALRTARSVPGRFELVNMGQQFTVIVDYAHTPDGLKNVLETARSLCKNKLIAVFGCGGDRDREKRPLMGIIAGTLSDYCILTSDNPRSESPGVILQEIEEGIATVASKYSIIEDRYLAIREAFHYAGPGDVVVIAGKGHENYQLLKDIAIPFNDREVAQEILQKEILS